MGACCFKRNVTVYLFSCPSLKVVKVVFLLVWYYVGVFVCENTFQSNSLDLLVLMAEQLKTEKNISYWFDEVENNY